jgi:N-acetylneuraminate lyase
LAPDRVVDCFSPGGVQIARRMTMTPLRGLIAAPFTPFHADGSLALERIPSQAAALVANGVSGAFVCGSTGEGASLTMAERQSVVESWVAAAAPGLRVVVHVGHTSVEESRTLAAHAAGAGASAFAAYAPSYYKPATVEELVACCERIAAAAPDLPFYYYHIPSMTGVHLSCVAFLKAAAGRIPNLAGIKFTHENLMEYLACLRFDGGRFDILFGRDECLAAALAVGAKGAIGSTYNYIAPVFRELMTAFAAGDLEQAADWQYRANQVIGVMAGHGGQPAGKAMMKITGLDCGPCRLPLPTLSEPACDRLRADLAAVDFPRWANVTPAEAG